MNLSEIWGQLLFNNASIICIRSNNLTFLPISIPNNNLQQNDDEISNSINSQQDVSDCEDEEGDNTEKNDQRNNERKNLQRKRYSREEYKCVLCPYTCTTEKAYLKHLRQCETQDFNQINQQLAVSCPICGKDRNNETSLSMHMNKHKYGKQFCCDLCKFKSIQLKKIIQHRRMHTGEKPHLCPHCNYRSSRRDNLRSHVRRVHKENNLNCDTFTPRSMLLTPSKNKEPKI